MREEASGGFPADYLVARVRARRAALVSDFRSLLAGGLPPGTTDESIWGGLLGELDWLHRQMDRGLRRHFAPVFVLFELKTVVLGVRNKAAGRADAIERLLARSLLAEPLRRALLDAPDVHASIVAATQVLAGEAAELGSLAAAYEEQGLKGFENTLMHAYLAHVAASVLHPVIRRFFASFIDLRNLMVLYKHLRWEMEEQAAFIPGGSLEAARFEQAAAAGELAGLDALASELTGPRALPVAASEGALETVLLGRLTRRLRRAGREDGDVAVILDYVWRRYVEARNLAVLYHAGDLGAAALERELVA